MNIVKKVGNSVILELDNKKVLGLSIGLPNKNTAGTNFSEIRKNKGYILTKGSLAEFKLGEITEIDNSVVIYSKDLELDIEPLFNGENDIETVKEIVQFLSLLKEKSVNNIIFATNLICKTGSGDLLIMPPELINFINERESLNKKLVDESIYIHPDLKDERLILFSMGILLFQFSTGVYPINYSDVEDLRDKMRRKKFLRPRWKNIKISPELSNLIEDLLDVDTDITLEEAGNQLNQIVEKGINREDLDYTAEKEQNRLDEEKMLRNEAIREQFIKHRGLFTGSALAAIVMIVFFGTIIGNALKPPSTAGFSKLQVIESYFTSFQNLDPELIDDVLKKGVRKNDSTEISTLYVTTKMRTQTDPSQQMLTPKQWMEMDEEERESKDVYGIYNLKIEPINDNKFGVKYEKWYTTPAKEDDLSVDVKMDIHKLVRDEIFTLQETKYSYEIIQIETISEKDEIIW